MTTSGGGFTFGSTPQPTLATTQTPSVLGSTAFGTQNTQSFAFGGQPTGQTTGQTNAFSFQPFGSTATTTAQTTFGLTQTPFSFTNPTTTTTAGSFNFGGLGQQTTSGSLFSGQQQQRPQAPTFNFTLGSTLGQNTLQPQSGAQQIPQTTQQNANIFAPKIYNDERDDIIAQFNRVQAFWGFGKAYYSAFMPPYDINQTDPTNRFKSIGYSEYRKSDDISDMLDNKIGFLVKMTNNESQLKTQLLTFEQNMKQIVGINLMIKLEITKVLPENKAVLSLLVTDPTTNKSLTSIQLQNYFNQQNIKNQLNNVFMNTFVNIVQMSSVGKQELEEYLNTPPKGIDERLWAQARHENPDPNRFIAVPLVGFSALNERFKLQERETEQHRMRLKLITDDVSALERHVMETRSKLDECRRKHIALSNRVLRIMIAQEMLRKRGYPIQADEDQLKAKLEAIQSELSAPTKFQGCLNELMSQLRQIQSQHQSGISVALDNDLTSQLKTFLKQEQEGISHLISIVKHDVKELDAIKYNKQSPNV
ncbi:nucleoporin p54-like [Oppia nitens]|uniref:nucleoporin p54-like n=1 Tax=Oppia nitens TaxID=1686743 RepID=UPI0023DAC9D2|nr:nucleoporin p54-like [Oppia nitens]